MQNRDERRARRQETLRRLNANEESLGRVSKERSDAAEEERQRKLKNETEIEREINRGWFARRFGAGG
jgi:hypothetical protein